MCVQIQTFFFLFCQTRKRVYSYIINMRVHIWLACNIGGDSCILYATHTCINFVFKTTKGTICNTMWHTIITCFLIRWFDNYRRMMTIKRRQSKKKKICALLKKKQFEKKFCICKFFLPLVLIFFFWSFFFREFFFTHKKKKPPFARGRQTT